MGASPLFGSGTVVRFVQKRRVVEREVGVVLDRGKKHRTADFKAFEAFSARQEF